MAMCEDLEVMVRAIPLHDRITMCQVMIGKMCKEGRPPKMSIPVQWDDEDFFIVTTLSDILGAEA